MFYDCGISWVYSLIVLQMTGARLYQYNKWTLFSAPQNGLRIIHLENSTTILLRLTPSSGHTTSKQHRFDVVCLLGSYSGAVLSAT